MIYKRRERLILILHLEKSSQVETILKFSGGLLYDYFMRGGMLKYVLEYINPSFGNTIVGNRRGIDIFLTSPGKSYFYYNNPFEYLSIVSSIMAIAIILGELTLVCLYFRKKTTALRDWLILLFVIFTFFFRLEYIFLSTIALIGFSLCDKNSQTQRSLLSILVIYLLSLSLLNAKLGIF